jgi:hypothetical protein
LTHRLKLFQGFVAERTIRLGINDDCLQVMQNVVGRRSWSPNLNRICSKNLVD